jgi:outer membrane protein TolC
LKAAGARTTAAAANVASIRQWEDPKASLGYMAARTANRADDGDVIYGVEQKLPLFKKPESARLVAQSGQAIAEATVEYQFQRLRADLTRAVLRTALAEREQQLTREDQAWLDAWTATLEEMNRNGRASSTDLLRLNSDRSKRAAQLVTIEHDLAHDRVTLNRLLNRPPESSWATLELPELAAPVPDTEVLLQAALQSEPRLRVMQREVEQASAVVNATRRQRMPDASVGLEGRSYSGNGSFRSATVLFSVSLPWGNGAKYRADLEREQQRQQAAELEISDYTLTLREDIHRLVTAIDAARREALLYRDEILPRAQQTLATTRAMWESERSPLRDVFDTRRAIVDAQLAYARAVTNQYNAMAELALLCGLPSLEALEHLTGGSAGGNPLPLK